MAMKKQFCLSCGRTKWHNQTTPKYSGWRCTFCGTPVPTGPKREQGEARRNKAIARPIKGEK